MSQYHIQCTVCFEKKNIKFEPSVRDIFDRFHEIGPGVCELTVGSLLYVHI